MTWTDQAIFWHIYPLGFCGAPIRESHGTPQPRLRRLLNWLDYAVRLGASGLLLAPIFTSQTHGYDTLDPFSIDPRLGTEQDFSDLVAACQERGLRIVLDGVFSHVGSGHPWYRADLRAGREANRTLFDIDWETHPPRPRVFEGHQGLVRLNHAGEPARRFAADVMTYWLDRGIDGWRLDAAYSVPRDFWADVLGRVRRSHPEAWFLGEVIHGDYAAFVRESTADTVTEYQLWKAIWSSIRERNFWELRWALTRLDERLDTFVPQTFVGNHDVTRIASEVGRDGEFLAVAILMTIAGIPSVYYGDERGLQAVKGRGRGSDDPLRPAYPDDPGELGHDGDEIFRAHQDLIGLRRRHPWLTRARTEITALTTTHIAYTSAAADHEMRLTVELDVGNGHHAVIREADGTVLWQWHAGG